MSITEADLWRQLCETVQIAYEEVQRLVERRHLALERRRLLTSLPNDASLARVQRYEAHLSRQFYKALHELQRMQAACWGPGPLAPPALDIRMSGGQDEGA